MWAQTAQWAFYSLNPEIGSTLYYGSLPYFSMSNSKWRTTKLTEESESTHVYGFTCFHFQNLNKARAPFSFSPLEISLRFFSLSVSLKSRTRSNHFARSSAFIDSLDLLLLSKILIVSSSLFTIFLSLVDFLNFFCKVADLLFSIWINVCV